jgi:hypothetical protein
MTPTCVSRLAGSGIERHWAATRYTSDLLIIVSVRSNDIGYLVLQSTFGAVIATTWFQ